MSPALVALCYGSAMALSLYLLWHYGAKPWYWHVLSVLLALSIGSLPMRGIWSEPGMTLLVGWVFVFLMVWGLAAAGFAVKPHLPTLRPRHR